MPSKNGNHGNTVYRLGAIEEILETIFYTAGLQGETPLSIILVADSGTAKSKMLLRYQSPGIHLSDSVTSNGLFEIAQNDRDNKKRFLLIGDLNATLSRRPTTTEATIANLLSFTGDGTCRVDDGRREKTVDHLPIGLVTACTPDIYDKQAKKWFALGLRRRLVPIFYDYSTETTRELLKMVREDRIRSAHSEKVAFVIPPPKSNPSISDFDSMQIEAMASKFALHLGKLSFQEGEIKQWYIRKMKEIAPARILRNLARAHALRGKRGKVNQEDLQWLARFVDFTDPEHPVKV